MQEAEGHFRLLSSEGPKFDHLTPALYLIEHRREFSTVAGIEESLDRFEKVFTTLNRLLS